LKTARSPDPDAFERSLEAVCAEYSPELQLRLLGLDPQRVESPVLDLGCGASASLVHYLRARGLPGVVGVDREAPAGTGLIRASWFDVPLPPGTWGTVIAHQSFSLHFVHAHLRSADRAERHARRTMEILGSLRVGGRFAYAPGLPFLERLLPAERFRVVTRPVPLEDAGLVGAALAAGPAAGMLHATVVERLA